jgi:hypothetical protein
MNRNKALLMVCTLGVGLSAESMAGVIAVDGSLSDWGLFAEANPTWSPKGNGSAMTHAKGSTYYADSGSYTHNGYQIYYTVNDYITGGNGFLSPGYGGQAYDAEAIYLTWDAHSLYVALVTGHDPNTQNNPSGNTYSAGDFALNFWSGTDNRTYEFGIRTPHQSNNIGTFTTDVYRTTNDDWLKDPLWKTQAVTSLDTSKLTAGDVAGQASMVVQQGPKKIGAGSDASRWIYEISVDRSILGTLALNSKLNVSWAMNCANDLIEVDPPFSTVDEPPVWALLGLTLPAMFWRRRRSSKR